nr:MAG TPA: hypothetical protein [Caudoviricetes sp.]
MTLKPMKSSLILALLMMMIYFTRNIKHLIPY